MQMNIDCIKDVLQYCIKNIDYKEDHKNDWSTTIVNLDILYEAEELKNYSRKDIMRSVLKLDEYKFIKVVSKFPENRPYLQRCSIEDITVKWYEFAEATKDPTIWQKTKSVVGSLGNQALSFVGQIAHDIAVESAKEMINIVSNPFIPR